MAKDIWGHTYISKYGNFVTEHLPHAVEYHYEENDGWSFARSGAQREIYLTIPAETTTDDLRTILREELKIDKQIREALEEMVQSGTIIRRKVMYDETNNPPIP